ncbi:sugar transferase [Fusobacterium animalis]|uniref:Sugar transferase n=1 Tax=Fusobacterium animalis TaxID=76859 RepID=A0A2G9FBF1_9FUSO|nr:MULTISPECIES: sugar transferase [Fusobacterium]EUB32015.1 sugar transferase [Fusobacterium sp. CM1]PIM90492.1 sugar transferase [Fusobacterium animalis]PIM91330.1 sugar transferase [Fusobacterium animalis]
MYKKFLKRIFDILASILFVILFWWLYVIIFCLIKYKLGSPVIFKQYRPGLNEKIFTLYKFRSMTDEKDEYGNLLPDEKRLTKFGRILRNTSLDEIPEVWNILKGEMSIVGPRPLLVEYLKYYKKSEKIRHTVRPGLTGWAQINGRNITPWDERLKQDIFYVENISFIFDIKIILLTIIKVFKRSDIKVGKEFGEKSARLDMERK